MTQRILDRLQAWAERVTQPAELEHAAVDELRDRRSRRDRAEPPSIPLDWEQS